MSEASKFCEECGTALEPGVQFCEECGQAVKTAAPVGRGRFTLPIRPHPAALIGGVAILGVVGLVAALFALGVFNGDDDDAFVELGDNGSTIATATADPVQPTVLPTQPVAVPTQSIASPTPPAALPTQPVALPTRPAASPTQPTRPTIPPSLPSFSTVDEAIQVRLAEIGIQPPVDECNNLLVEPGAFCVCPHALVDDVTALYLVGQAFSEFFDALLVEHLSDGSFTAGFTSFNFEANLSCLDPFVRLPWDIG